MVTKSKGFRWGTRKKLKKKGGAIGITRYVQSFEKGEMVIIAPITSSHAGVPFSRFIVKSGEIVSRRGNSFEVRFNDGNAVKRLLLAPEHIRKLTK